MDNLTALKNLYVALGGDSVDVADMTLLCDVINRIATEVSGTGGMLPKVSGSDNGKVLKVVLGTWATGTDNT